MLKKLPLLLTSSLLLACLAGCSTAAKTDTANLPPPKTDTLIADTNAVTAYPYNIKIYPEDTALTTPYQTIGHVSISDYNRFGIKRQDAKINLLFREEAAAIGGDALIMTDASKHTREANVIRFIQVS